MLTLLTGWQVWTVRTSLTEARAELQEVAGHLQSREAGAATDAARRAEDAAARADFHSHTPVWWLSQVLPMVGDDVTAVRTLSRGSHTVARDVVAPLVESGLTLDRFRPRGGRLDIAPLREASTYLHDASPAMAEVEGEVTALAPGGLIGAIRGPVLDAQRELARVASLTRAAAVATELLPAMLGGERRRTYLIVFQNNAEVRATGGLAGSFGVLSAEGGKLSMKRTVLPTLLENGEPAAPLTRSEMQIFTQRMAVFARNINFTPDFPRAAQLLSAFWDRTGRPPVDGVLSLDPVALSYLINYTGPITLSNGTTLTPDNTVSTLLRDAYLEPDPRKQDAFFNEAALTIFDSALQSADGSVQAFVGALRRGIDERRIAVWSARRAEQAVLAKEDVANALPQRTGRPEVGVYFNDSAADKLSYYLHAKTKVDPESCSESGVQRLAVTVRLSSDAPRTGLPDYVAANGVSGPRGTMRNTVYLYAPAGGRIDAVTLDDEEPAVTLDDHDARPVAYTTIDLRPGESTTLRYTAYTGESQQEDIRVLTTPLADGTGGESYTASACG